MLDQRYSDNDVSRRDVPSFIEPRPPLILHPFMRPRPQKATNLLERFEEDSEIEEPELVQVYLRLKPSVVPNNLYEVRSDRCLVTSLDTATAGHGRRTQHNVSKMYTFSKIFRADCSQKEIFEQVVKENLKKLPDGQNFTLLTYGASGSGKTYTLMGDVNYPGLVPRSLEYVFRLVEAAQQPSYKPTENGSEKLSFAEQEYELQWVKRLQNVSAPLRDRYRRMSTQLRQDLTSSTMDLANRTRYYVWVSFVEIYNEAIYDLLASPDKRTKLRIREDSSGNVYVKGATYAFVRSGEEAYDVMVAGKHNLIVAATGVHAHSSRSHCIFTINMLTETDGEVRTSCIRLCDLAGCERARATRNTGARMQESRAINSSLHVLERCLHMLRRKQRQRQETLVPYRESKLTRLLGSGLSGSRGEAVSMVVTLNPSPQYAHETKHVLGLAAVAQDIQINHTTLGSTLSLESSTQDSTIGSSAEVMKLRADNERLHFELAQAQAYNKELLASMEESQLKSAETMQELVDEARDISRQYYESQIQSLRSEMDDMKEEYERELAKISVPSTRQSDKAGTPSRYLQSKVTQLMEEIAVLEEELTAERLARDRAEKEVQHLRTCIEERDEKVFEEREVVSLNDSEAEEDPFNESLEPTFTKEHLNRTQSLYIDNNKEATFDENDFSNDNKNNDNDSVLDKSANTLKCDESVDDIRQSSISTDAESEDDKKIDKTNASITNVDRTNDIIVEDDEFINNDKNQSTHNEMSNIHDSVDSDINLNITGHSKLSKNNYDTKSNYIIVENDVAQLNGDLETEQLAPNSRGTYFVSTDKNEFTEKENFKTTLISLTHFVKDSHHSTDKDDLIVKTDIRGTYFVMDNEEKTNKIDSNIIKEEKNTSIIKHTEEKSIKNDSNTIKEAGETYFPQDIKNNTNSHSSLNDNSFNKEFKNGSLTNADKVIESKIDTEITEKVSETLVNKIIKSIKTAQSSDSSLRQFEQLEMAAKTFDDHVKKAPNEFGAPKITKKVRNYFEDIAKEGSNEFLVEDFKEKRTYFDNIDANDKPYFNKGSIASHLKNDDSRSPSIVKDEVMKDLGPSTIKQLLGESFSKKTDVMSSINQNKLLIKKHDSVDIFDGFDSPHILNKTKEKVGNLEEVPLISIESKNKLEHKSASKMQNDVKQQPLLSVQECNIADNHQSESIKLVDKTIDEFENIYKDISAPRATEFELLVSQEIKSSDLTQNEVKTDQELFETVEEAKYNLRHRLKLLKRQDAEEEVLAESHSKCASQVKPTKRNLRLRRRKNQTEDEKSDQENDKLKDILNLQKEFSDVTMDVRAPIKEVKDIPSPKNVNEAENVSPLLGIQSCPSKSVIRSRRKLFTPRVEPLEESLSQTADSNERIYVPRPSYHRTRARRKL